MYSGAKTVPRNHANKNKTAKSKENMQILAIKSIENISKNAIHIACCFSLKVTRLVNRRVQIGKSKQLIRIGETFLIGFPEILDQPRLLVGFLSGFSALWFSAESVPRH